MLRDISLKLLLVTGFMVIGLIPIMIFALTGLHTSRVEFRRQAFRHLESVRDIKKHQISDFFSERIRNVTVLSSNPYVVKACRELTAAFRANGGVEGRRFRGRMEGRYDAPASYRRVHDRHLPHFRKIARAYGYYDLFLMTPAQGDTVFTLRKESDFGIRIADVPSSLRDVWRRTGSTHAVALSDTKPYPPSFNAPAQFMAAPVRDGERVIGILAIQISIDAIDRIMQERSGMWETGETYLVGQNFRMRSDSFLDRRRHSVQASLNGSVAENGVDTPSARSALKGGTGLGITRNYRGARVLSAYTPVEILGIKWALIAEISENEIDEHIAGALNTPLVTLFVLSAVILLLLSWIASGFLNRGLRRTTGQLKKMISDILQGDLDSRGDSDSVGVDFREVVRTANQLIEAFAQQSRDKKKLEEHIQLTQRLKAIGTLAGGIAHDFNNILTSLFAYAYIVRAELPAKGTAREGMEEIITGLRRASEMVEQILVFNRAVKSEKSVVEVSRLVRETVKLLKAALPKQVELELKISPGEKYIRAVPSQINQILMNLCTNARDALKEKGGSLVVSLSEFRHEGKHIPGLGEGRFCRLSVIDNGPGIPPQIRSRIFEPFFTTKPPGQGSGMGLSTVHGIVSGNGGAVDVESEPGRGARFDVYLPLIDPRKEGPGTEALPEPPGGRGEHLLFVDDEEPICRSHKQTLEARGFRVTLSDPEAALKRIIRGARGFDLIITDLNMPHVNGLEIVTAANRHAPSCPVIVISGFQKDTEQLQRITDLENLAAFLKKPYETDQLIRTIRRALDKPPERRQPAEDPADSHDGDRHDA